MRFGLMRLALRAARRLRADRAGNVALVFALALPLLALIVAGALDLNSLLATRFKIQESTDAAGLAVSAATSANPNATETTLRALATNVIAANYPGVAPQLADFHVCTAIQNDCTTGAGTAMVENTVYIGATTTAPCYMPFVLPGVCTSTGASAPIAVSNTSNIGIPSNIQISLLMDVSGSMIVGSTPADVSAVEAWNKIPANWATVHNSNESAQSIPCAFACHDNGPSSQGVNGPTTSGAANSNMQQGLTNAHAAGATTRFDVMISAANNLITHVHNEIASNSQLAKNSYYFNISSMADSVTNAYTATTPNDWTDPQTAVNNLNVGLDTHLNADLASYATTVAKGGTGGTAASPLKFVIIVTDGLQSDFYSDFYGCTGRSYDSAWSGAPAENPAWSGYYYTGCYSAAPSTASCTTMKNNGVIVAVLETPYVPLTGQDPGEGYLYESFVRHTIYPTGPSGTSVVSAALQSCASSGYYYQASSSDPTTISSGFVTLTDKYLASLNYIRQ